MPRPYIAVATYPPKEDDSRVVASASYLNALLQHGALPILLPPPADADTARDLLQACQGLLLTGGGDLAAKTYGTEDGGKLTFVLPERDRIELMYTRLALELGMPVFGICRGIQTLNVAAGGTLVQDVPSEIPNALVHSTQALDAHTVEIAAGSLLAEVIGRSGQLMVNSRHHQAAAQAAPILEVTARAPDGVIEAVEARDGRYIVGVQWHPETLLPDDAAAAALFERFAAACSEYRQ
ncbi:MAG: gamma-glutamyl-gamma-aminobutyrate hydrolase family protein [Chloroflexi bacterium]|nr:gamma-glutamyl-gamma-aminobutyrate hydrolase family protein [Chloroflexota bacterium]